MKCFVRREIVQSRTIARTINFLSHTIRLQKSAQFSFFPAPACQRAWYRNVKFSATIVLINNDLDKYIHVGKN